MEITCSRIQAHAFLDGSPDMVISPEKYTAKKALNVTFEDVQKKGMGGRPGKE